MFRTKSGLKALSFVVSVFFMAEQVLWAAPFPAAQIPPARPASAATILPVDPSVIVSDPSRIDLPHSFTTLKEMHRGTNGKLIIHIQDAHANLSGQQSLAGALDHMLSRYQIPVVFVEGGDREGTLDEVKKIASAKEWAIAAKRLLFDGVITGEEYLNLTTDHPMRLMGIEYTELYKSNLEAYGELVEKRKEILRYLHRIGTALERVKNRMYSKDLLEYERVKNETGVSFGDTNRILFELAAKAGVATTDFSQIESLKSIQELEKRIDFKKATEEQAALFDALRRAGASEDIRRFADISKRSKNGQIAQWMLLKQIFEAASVHGIRVETYSEMEKYRLYLERFSTLAFDRLLEELESFESLVYDTLLTSDDALKIRAVDRYVGLLKNAYSIRMSSREFGMLIDNEPFFATASWQAFVNGQLQELGYFDDLLPYQPYFEEANAALKNFYRLVNQRDLGFLENAERIMVAQGQDAAFLIAGGYHTEHLTKLLRERGYSYLVLTPVVLYETDHDRYEEVLLSPLKLAKKKAERASVVASAPVPANELLPVADDGVRAGNLYFAEGGSGARGALVSQAKSYRSLFDVGGMIGKLELTRGARVPNEPIEQTPAPAPGARVNQTVIARNVQMLNKPFTGLLAGLSKVTNREENNYGADAAVDIYMDNNGSILQIGEMKYTIPNKPGLFFSVQPTERDDGPYEIRKFDESLRPSNPQEFERLTKIAQSTMEAYNRSLVKQNTGPLAFWDQLTITTDSLPAVISVKIGEGLSRFLLNEERGRLYFQSGGGKKRYEINTAFKFDAESGDAITFRLEFSRSGEPSAELVTIALLGPQGVQMELQPSILPDRSSGEDAKLIAMRRLIASVPSIYEMSVTDPKSEDENWNRKVESAVGVVIRAYALLEDGRIGQATQIITEAMQSAHTAMRHGDWSDAQKKDLKNLLGILRNHNSNILGNNTLNTQGAIDGARTPKKNVPPEPTTGARGKDAQETGVQAEGRAIESDLKGALRAFVIQNTNKRARALGGMLLGLAADYSWKDILKDLSTRAKTLNDPDFESGIAEILRIHMVKASVAIKRFPPITHERKRTLNELLTLDSWFIKGNEPADAGVLKEFLADLKALIAPELAERARVRQEAQEATANAMNRIMAEQQAQSPSEKDFYNWRADWIRQAFGFEASIDRSILFELFGLESFRSLMAGYLRASSLDVTEDTAMHIASVETEEQMWTAIQTSGANAAEINRALLDMVSYVRNDLTQRGLEPIFLEDVLRTLPADQLQIAKTQPVKDAPGLVYVPKSFWHGTIQNIGEEGLRHGNDGVIWFGTTSDNGQVRKRAGSSGRVIKETKKIDSVFVVEFLTGETTSDQAESLSGDGYDGWYSPEQGVFAYVGHFQVPGQASSTGSRTEVLRRNMRFIADNKNHLHAGGGLTVPDFSKPITATGWMNSNGEIVNFEGSQMDSKKFVRFDVTSPPFGQDGPFEVVLDIPADNYRGPWKNAARWMLMSFRLFNASSGWPEKAVEDSNVRYLADRNYGLGSALADSVRGFDGSQTSGLVAPDGTILGLGSDSLQTNDIGYTFTIYHRTDEAPFYSVSVDAPPGVVIPSRARLVLKRSVAAYDKRLSVSHFTASPSQSQSPAASARKPAQITPKAAPLGALEPQGVADFRLQELERFPAMLVLQIQGKEKIFLITKERDGTVSLQRAGGSKRKIRQGEQQVYAGKVGREIGFELIIDRRRPAWFAINIQAAPELNLEFQKVFPPTQATEAPQKALLVALRAIPYIGGMAMPKNKAHQNWNQLIESVTGNMIQFAWLVMQGDYANTSLLSALKAAIHSVQVAPQGNWDEDQINNLQEIGRILDPIYRLFRDDLEVTGTGPQASGARANKSVVADVGLGELPVFVVVKFEGDGGGVGFEVLSENGVIWLRRIGSNNKHQLSERSGRVVYTGKKGDEEIFNITLDSIDDSQAVLSVASEREISIEQVSPAEIEIEIDRGDSPTAPFDANEFHQRLIDTPKSDGSDWKLVDFIQLRSRLALMSQGSAGVQMQVSGDRGHLAKMLWEAIFPGEDFQASPEPEKVALMIKTLIDYRDNYPGTFYNIDDFDPNVSGSRFSREFVEALLEGWPVAEPLDLVLLAASLIETDRDGQLTEDSLRKIVTLFDKTRSDPNQFVVLKPYLESLGWKEEIDQEGGWAREAASFAQIVHNLQTIEVLDSIAGRSQQIKDENSATKKARLDRVLAAVRGVISDSTRTIPEIDFMVGALNIFQSEFVDKDRRLWTYFFEDRRVQTVDATGKSTPKSAERSRGLFLVFEQAAGMSSTDTDRAFVNFMSLLNDLSSSDIADTLRRRLSELKTDGRNQFMQHDQLRRKLIPEIVAVEDKIRKLERGIDRKMGGEVDILREIKKLENLNQELNELKQALAALSDSAVPGSPDGASSDPVERLNTIVGARTFSVADALREIAGRLEDLQTAVDERAEKRQSLNEGERVLFEGVWEDWDRVVEEARRGVAAQVLLSLKGEMHIEDVADAIDPTYVPAPDRRRTFRNGHSAVKSVADKLFVKSLNRTFKVTSKKEGDAYIATVENLEGRSDLVATILLEGYDKMYDSDGDTSLLKITVNVLPAIRIAIPIPDVSSVGETGARTADGGDDVGDIGVKLLPDRLESGLPEIVLSVTGGVAVEWVLDGKNLETVAAAGRKLKGEYVSVFIGEGEAAYLFVDDSKNVLLQGSNGIRVELSISKDVVPALSATGLLDPSVRAAPPIVVPTTPSVARTDNLGLEEITDKMISKLVRMALRVRARVSRFSDRNLPVNHALNLDRLLAKVPSESRQALVQKVLRPIFEKLVKEDNAGFIFEGNAYGLQMVAIEGGKKMVLDNLSESDLSLLADGKTGGMFYELPDTDLKAGEAMLVNLLPALILNGIIARIDIQKIRPSEYELVRQILSGLAHPDIKFVVEDFGLLQTLQATLEARARYTQLALRPLRAEAQALIAAYQMAISNIDWTA